MPGVIERIRTFNQNRNLSLLPLKYQAMRHDAFAFFRGTCHLFYEDWSPASPLNQAPSVWICGDLHLENFGSYKGRDRLVYFDINDFDEAVLAPCTWELARFLTSILVAAQTLGIDQTDAQALCQNFLTAYTRILARGLVGIVNRDTATGLVKELLCGLKTRKRKDFLHKRTEKVGQRRQLRIDPSALPITPSRRESIAAALRALAIKQKEPKFFRLLDMAYRIAGTGSLGLERYILLVEGEGSPNNNYLLDLKLARPSSLQPYVVVPQPQWKTEADRIVAIQQRVQWAPPDLMVAIACDGQDYVLRELQPMDDRVNLMQWNGKLKRLRKVIETMAEVTAWGQLLSSGRQGSAIADELIAFAQSIDWHKSLLDYAQSYAAQVEADFRVFRKADLRELGVEPSTPAVASVKT